MTYTTPPGWYPDPGHTGDGPPTQRWWDGTAWTDQVHVDAALPAVWGPPAVPPYPALPPSGRRNLGRRIAVGSTALVVALAIAGGFYLLGRDAGDNNAADGLSQAGAPQQPGPGGQNPFPGGPGGGQGFPPGGGQGAPGQGAPGQGAPGQGAPGQGAPGQGAPGQGGPGGGAPAFPQTEDGYATDGASGIDIPIPAGWTGSSGLGGAGVTIGNYPCPGDTSQTCVRGGVFSAPATPPSTGTTTAKAAALKDIGANAKDSYSGNGYGTITSHQQLKSEAVTVAGQHGYLVRWKVVTSKGDDGYVQSLAFPSPVAPKVMVLVRYGFDVNAKAPKLSVMDTITKGIKVAASPGAGGAGQGV